VVRHAQAQRCRASVAVVDARLRLEVTDDGLGLAGARRDGHGRGHGHGHGHGLHTMRERAEELRGHLRLSSGHGTTVVAEIPLPQVPLPSGNAKAATS
jgi:signal transduction histidine kinase